MHELSLAINILEIAEDHARQAGASSIGAVVLRVGALSGVEPSALELAFQVAQQGTMAHQARLEVECVAGRAMCERCGLEFDVDAGLALCPTCGQPSATFIRGRELEVRSLEVV